MENEDFSSLSEKKLKKLIRETHMVLDQLTQELNQRKQDKQHEEINHIEEHFDEASHNLGNLKIFIQKVFAEMTKDK